MTMSPEQALTHWSTRFFEWSIVAADPADAANEAEARAWMEGITDMAQTAVDGLLQAGYSSGETATALARGAYLTFAEMIRHYVPEGG